MLQQVNMRTDEQHLPLQTQLVAGASIFSALAYLATVPIIHRDIKPANILIVVNQEHELVKALLADFGEAKQLNRTVTVRTVAGTPVYMAPENREDEAARSPKLDVFSAGVVVVEMSSGVPPNPGPEMRQRVAVPEEQRRASDMAAVRQAEILAIARQCIVDDPEGRASAQHIMAVYLEALHDAQRRARVYTVRSLRAPRYTLRRLQPNLTVCVADLREARGTRSHDRRGSHDRNSDPRPKDARGEGATRTRVGPAFSLRRPRTRGRKVYRRLQSDGCNSCASTHSRAGARACVRRSCAATRPPPTSL